MNKWNVILSIILWGIVASGCSSDGDDEIASSPFDTSNPINWVGSETVFGNNPQKSQYSMLFVGTSWCTFCEQMKAGTFNDSTVVELLNNHFNSVQIYADSDSTLIYLDTAISGHDLAQIYTVRGYPTMIFLDSNNAIVSTIEGYRGASDMTTILNNIIQ